MERTLSLFFARLAAVAILSLAACAPKALAQAAYTANGPGKYIDVGAAASAFDSDYGSTKLGGLSLYADANLTWRFGAEFEARQLRFHEDPDGAHQSTYMAGPRLSFHARHIRPYAKFLAGRGQFTFPFNYAHGSYFAMAPGAGLDWKVGNRIFVRVVDVEYQLWPNFNYGAPPPYPTLKPFGASAGIAIRVF